ncbi:uncharacterized protein BDFB_000923 [Asbolus verrucosus]|uniref:Uncharacterized protein n=1 Tax=Asbolus verrucosus TaxID=1661398 RepID=A0A482VJG7_ASBVE|nr:uncharacterized protein BDFB_000923 [Asbolus verrucosus]
MADFDIIEYGYNIADETINFGTRSLADGDNLYEASTLATLKCSLSNEGKSCPHLNAVVKNGFIHFNVDGSMKIFKDKACSSVVFNACFDAVVDTFCLSSDGSYLFICLRNGMVHLVHCNNDYEFITSTSLTEDKNKSNISEIVSFQYPFMLVSGTKLAILNFKNDTIIFDGNKNLKKVVSVDNMFLGLDFEGNLFGICAVTLVIFPLYNSTLYKDFLICGSNNQRQIIAVTEDESQNFFIQLISYPEFSKIFSLKISTEVHLITPECINDEILYISKISHDNSVNELRFHIVYETEPEQRLLRLLRKHKYEEAEKFAIFFHLDLAIINKARAQAIIDKSVCESDDINVLINLLNMIDDDEFKLQCCLDVESFCSKFDDVRRILNYGCSLTPKKQNKLIVEELQKSITRLMFRFDTFTALNWETDYMMRSWLQFSGSDLIEELTAFLRNHHIEEAKIVYSRLDELTEEHVADVLCVLNNMSFSVYQPFLPIFIPVTLSILPSTLPLFVKWTYSKVLHLEKRSKLDFPNNAIKFTENILGLMKVGDATDISFQRQCMLHRDNLGELSLLLSALKSLKTLKYDFRITIPLSDYLSGPVDVIRNLLNVQLCPEDFDVLLKDFLFKFMLENHLDPNEIFFNEINIKTTSDSLRPLSNKYKVVDDILEDVCREFETGKRTVEETFSICHKIAASLSLDYDDIYVKLCEKTGDYNLIFKIARRIYDQESSSKNLCLMAILLIKYIGIYKIQLSDDSFLESEGLILSDTNCIVDNDDFCHGLQLAEKIVARVVFKAQLEDVSACVEVVNWDQLFAEIKQLPIMVENLCKEGQHFMSFKVVSQLQNSLMHIPNIDTNILIFLNDVLKKQCLPKLLPSILSNSVIDSDLLYNLLLSCNCNDGVQFIMNSLRLYKRHPRKFQCIAQTGLRFWEYQNLSCGKSEIMKSLIALKWWKKFEKKQFDYDSFFKVQSDERFELLINSDCLDTKLVEEYSVDYNVCLKLSYKYFLKRTFLNWKPDYEIKSKTSNGRYLVMKNNEDALLEKCQEIIKLIDKHEVLTIIIDVWSCVNRYYYEVFITMFNIIAEIDPKQDNNMKLSMLFFLRDYQRVSKPSEAETESWYTTFPESRSLDTLSEFRLPFSPCLFTRQIWSIIRPEINLKTYKLWFNAIEIVAPYLNKNDICTYVVHDVVASGILSKDVSEKWVLYPKHEDLFSEIDECILHISDLERTTSVVYHLLTHTPNGADQVNAATLCYKYAVQYKNLNEGKSDVEKAFIKVEKKYFNSCVMHILHMHQLAETKYVNLVAQPNDLIFALYLDERILKKSESIDLYCPGILFCVFVFAALKVVLDINETTEAIASLFGLDINKIRHTLLENWLLECPSTSFDFDSSIIYTQNSSCESDNLIRAAYICCTGNIQFWRTYLLKIGLNSEPEVQKSVGYKARALKVFAMISDVETITNLIELSYDEFMNFIDKLTLVYNLEYLGIDLDVEALDRYSKKELLNRLAQRAGNLLTIKTMASICMTYKIYNLKYWEFIINTSIKFSMFVELKSYVNFLKKVEYRYKKFYINAWQKLIENSFTSINNIQENQIHQVLVDNFLTIQCCPVVYCLNFDSVFRKCMNTGKIEFAAVLLQYVDGERRDKFVKEIRNSNKDFGTSLSNLAQNGLWGIPHVRAILVEVND